jgi:hypothetical protein
MRDAGQPDRQATNVDGSRNLKKPAILLGWSLFSGLLVDGILIDLAATEGEEGSCLKAHFIAWVGLEPVEAPSHPASLRAANTRSHVWANRTPSYQEWLIL